MNNLIAAKVILLIASVLSALAAVYPGQSYKIFGFCASGLCFTAFLILVFYKTEEADDYDEYVPAAHKKNKVPVQETPSYQSPVQEIKQNAAPQNTGINFGGGFKQVKESDFAKEDIMNEKIKLLNKFASVASHDLKNPLSSMKNIAYYFTNSVKIEGEVPNKMLRMLSSEVDRMNTMIVDLLDTTRVKQLNKTNSNLKTIVTEAAEQHKSDKYVFEISVQELFVYADSERMKQVFASIIQNAKEAMPEGGTITVKAYKSANEAFVEISDTGTGMDSETLAHCFDPIFSTKQARALGMSLTVSKQIVTMHGGTIKAESVFGKGSKFTINLPLAVSV